MKKKIIIIAAIIAVFSFYMLPPTESISNLKNTEALAKEISNRTTGGCALAGSIECELVRVKFKFDIVGEEQN